MSKEIKVGNEGIDEEVIKVMTDKKLLKMLDNPRDIKRYELNALCELLSMLNKTLEKLIELNSTITILSNDKLVDIFTNIKDVDEGKDEL